MFTRRFFFLKISIPILLRCCAGSIWVSLRQVYSTSSTDRRLWRGIRIDFGGTGLTNRQFLHSPGSTWRDSPGSTWRDSPGSTWRDSPGSTWRDSPGSTWRQYLKVVLEGSTWRDSPGSTWRDSPGSTWRDSRDFI